MYESRLQMEDIYTPAPHEAQELINSAEDFVAGLRWNQNAKLDLY